MSDRTSDIDAARWAYVWANWHEATPEEARLLAAKRPWVVEFGITVDCTVTSAAEGDDFLRELWASKLELDGVTDDWGEPEIMSWEVRPVGNLYEHHLVIETSYEFQDVQYETVPTTGDNIPELMFDLIRPRSVKLPNDLDIVIHELRAWPIVPG